MSDKRAQHFDLVVVGAGPAGLAAARAAAVARFSVALIDENPHPGGQIWRRDICDATSKKNQIVDLRRRELDRLGVQIFCGVTVVGGAHDQELGGAHDQMLGASQTRSLGAAQSHRLFLSRGDEAMVLSCERLVLATGARERFLPFEGWTRPGVFGTGGLQALVNNGFDIKGKRIVVAGTGPLLIAVAAAFQEAGAAVQAIVEQVSAHHVRRLGVGLWKRPAKLVQAFGYMRSLAKIRRVYDAWPLKALGQDKLESVVLRTVTGRQALSCDLLACGFGLVPEIRLARYLGCEDRLGSLKVDDNQETSVAGIFAAGEPCGIGGLDCALVEGEIAGLAAVGRIAAAAKLHAKRDKEREFAKQLEATFALRDELKEMSQPRTLICRCEDVTRGELDGFTSVREAKLATRAGMGTCQARVCGPALQFLYGWPEEQARLPLAPISMASFGVYAAATAKQKDRHNDGL
ncbi:MAG: FAD-dependent oxidoreductase [Planctomycetota bacterium]